MKGWPRDKKSDNTEDKKLNTQTAKKSLQADKMS